MGATLYPGQCGLRVGGRWVVAGTMEVQGHSDTEDVGDGCGGFLSLKARWIQEARWTTSSMGRRREEGEAGGGMVVR